MYLALVPYLVKFFFDIEKHSYCAFLVVGVDGELVSEIYQLQLVLVGKGVFLKTNFRTNHVAWVVEDDTLMYF